MTSNLDVPTKYLTEEVQKAIEEDGYRVIYWYRWGYPGVVDNSVVTHFDKHAEGWGLPTVIEYLIRNKIPFDHDFDFNSKHLNLKDIRYRPGTDWQSWGEEDHPLNNLCEEYRNSIIKEYDMLRYSLERVDSGERTPEEFVERVRRSFECTEPPRLEDM